MFEKIINYNKISHYNISHYNYFIINILLCIYYIFIIIH